MKQFYCISGPRSQQANNILPVYALLMCELHGKKPADMELKHQGSLTQVGLAFTGLEVRKEGTRELVIVKELV